MSNSTKLMLLTLAVGTMNVASAAAQAAWPVFTSAASTNTTESPEQLRTDRIAIGSVIGGIAALGAVIGGVLWCRERRAAQAADPERTSINTAAPQPPRL